MEKKDISFIIPAFNEEANIGDVMDAIRESIGKRLQYEVVVVDNGSGDRTVQISQEKGAICFLAPNCSISTLRNLGASEARSEILVFLDADVYLTRGWGERVLEVMEQIHRQPHIITGSFCGISDENNWIERVWFAPRANRNEEVKYMNSGHMIMHRSLFLRIAGFDPKLETGEDYEFCARARRKGARIKNDSGLKVVHAGYPKNIVRFFGRERWHARGDYKSLKTLASSKPALASLANLCIAVICLISIFISSQPWYIFLYAYLLFFAGLSLAASIYRYRAELNLAFCGTFFLHMIYFAARTVSIVDIAILSVVERRSKHSA